eukprot:6486992-Amphidinium_carterae.1
MSASCCHARGGRQRRSLECQPLTPGDLRNFAFRAARASSAPVMGWMFIGDSLGMRSAASARARRDSSKFTPFGSDTFCHSSLTRASMSLKFVTRLPSAPETAVTCFDHVFLRYWCDLTEVGSLNSCRAVAHARHPPHGPARPGDPAATPPEGERPRREVLSAARQ